MKAIPIFSVVFGAILVVPIIPALAGQTPPQGKGSSPAPNLPPGEGKDQLVATCQGCHALTVVTNQRKSESGWTDTVIEMRSRGANGSDDDMEKIVRYLTTNFGPDSAPAAGSGASAKVNVNSAATSDMVSGFSLSQSDADAIVAYREKNGKFKDLAGLKQVPGVDAAKIDAAKDKIDF